MLNVDGTMVFDDCTWKGYVDDCYNPRIAIQSFLRCTAQEGKTKQVESQLWVAKVPNHIPPSPNPDPFRYDWDEYADLKPEHGCYV